MAFTGGSHHVPHGSQSPDVTGIINCSVVHNSPGSRWIVDTGDTNHMVSTHKFLYETQNPSPSESEKVHLPNGQQIPIHFIGKSKLDQLTKDLQCCMVFYPGHCMLQDLHTGEVKGTGNLENGLYYWSHNVGPAAAPSTALSMMDTADLWHRRLGHISHKILQQMHLPHVSATSKQPSCSICPLAKQTRLRFPQSTSRCNSVFDLIHGDVWGPYRTPTCDSNRYFLTLVDDCSRMVWIFLLKLKSGVSIVLKDFLNLIHRQFDSHIKVYIQK